MDFLFNHLKTAIVSVTLGVFLIAAYFMTSTTSSPAFGSTAYVQNAIIQHPHTLYWQMLETGDANLGVFGGLSSHEQRTLFVDAVRYCTDNPAPGQLHAACPKIINVANDSPF